MLSAINVCGTKAANVVENLIRKDGFCKRELVSRFAASTIPAVPLLLLDVVANLGVGVAKAVWAPVAKLYELAAAIFGADRQAGNYLCEAFNHLGKSLAGIVATVLTIPIGLIFPAAAVAMYRGLGLAMEAPKPANSVHSDVYTAEAIHKELVSQRSVGSTVMEEVLESSLVAPVREPSVLVEDKEVAPRSPVLETVAEKLPADKASPVVVERPAEKQKLLDRGMALIATYGPSVLSTANRILQNRDVQIGTATVVGTLICTHQLTVFQTTLAALVGSAWYAATKPAATSTAYIA